MDISSTVYAKSIDNDKTAEPHHPKLCYGDDVPPDQQGICPPNQRCEDEDFDGHWTCSCPEGHHIPDPNDGHCVLSKGAFTI